MAPVVALSVRRVPKAAPARPTGAAAYGMPRNAWTPGSVVAMPSTTPFAVRTWFGGNARVAQLDATTENAETAESNRPALT